MPKSLSVSLGDGFESLLYSWPLWDTAAVLDFKAPAGSVLTTLELERKHGDGRYADRRILLAVSLDALGRMKKGKADRDQVLEALLWARGKLLFNARLRRAKAARAWALELEPWVKARRKLLRELKDYLAIRSGPLASLGDDARHARALYDVLRREDPAALNQRFSGPRGGRPSERPIVQEARARLARAGVPSGIPGFKQRLAHAKCGLNPPGLRSALLMAVGVIPVR